FHQLDCDYTAGLLSCVPALFGQPVGRLSHPVCGVNGAESCLYDISWSRHSSPLHMLLGAGAVGILAVGSAALFAPGFVPSGLGIAAAAGATTAWRLRRATRRRWD